MKVFFLSLLLIGAACSSKKKTPPVDPPFYAPKTMKVEGPQIPLSRSVLYFPFGSGDETPGYEGSTWLMSSWMDYGTLALSAQEYHRALKALGAVVSTKVYPRFTLMAVEAPNEHFDQAWGLLLEKIRTPKMDAADLLTTKERLLSYQRGRLLSWSEAGRQLSQTILYAGTKDAQLDVGKPESIKNLDSHRLKEYYAKTFAQGPSTVLVSDGLPLASEAAIAKSLESWQAPFKVIEPEVPARAGKRLVFIERPGHTQTYFFFVKPGPKPGTQEHALVALGTQLLGSNGGNSSVLFDKLRAERGLTYHASLQVSKSPYRSPILGLTFGDNDKAEELLKLYLEEWERFHSNEELKLYQLQEAATAFRAILERENADTLASLLQSTAESFAVTGKAEVPWKKPEIDMDDFLAAKKQWLSTDGLTVLVFGDSNLVKEGIIRAMGEGVKVQVLPPETDWDGINSAMLSF